MFVSSSKRRSVDSDQDVSETMGFFVRTPWNPMELNHRLLQVGCSLKVD
jgi:hypothetical protein